MSNRLKPLFRALLLSGVLLCASGSLGSVAPASAANKVPCWKTLLNDWYDGSISKIYPIHCYQDAINHLPADVEVYSSAKDDILNEEAAAVKKQDAPPEKTTSTATTAPSTTTTSPATTSSAATTTAHTTTTHATTAQTTTAQTTTAHTTTAHTTTAKAATTTAQTIPPTTTDATPPKKKNFFAKLTPGGPQSFPLPLLILGALAILLVAAGGAGMIWRRLQERDSGTQ